MKSPSSPARVHVCTCARVHVCTCARVHVCMCACMCARVHVCTCARMHVCMCARVHVCMHVCMHVCTCACVHACVQACGRVTSQPHSPRVGVALHEMNACVPLDGMHAYACIMHALCMHMQSAHREQRVGMAPRDVMWLRIELDSRQSLPGLLSK